MSLTTDAESLRRLSPTDAEVRVQLGKALRSSPIPSDELLANLPLYQDYRALGHVLYMHELYQHILDVPGIIVECGTRFGPNLATLLSLRTLYEPHNPQRKIVGFDTFDGFRGLHEHDSPQWCPGDFSVPTDYAAYLTQVLRLHEAIGTLPERRRFTLVQGDARQTVPQYLGAHPETIIALAHFDMDLYAPTHVCLEAVLPYLAKGAVLSFDELATSEFPGETVAVRDVLGLSRCRLRHSRFRGHAAYLVWE